jgi:hypothetical protein
MMRLLRLYPICCLVLSCSLSASDSWILRENGIGPVKIGMSLIQLNTALHAHFRRPVAKDEQACFYVRPKQYPGIAFMIEDGRLSRIDVEKSGVRTDSGIQVGDLESRVHEVYGKRIVVEEHKYFENGHYLTIRSTDGHSALRFETNEGKITSFYAGTSQAIQYVEGCL